MKEKKQKGVALLRLGIEPGTSWVTCVHGLLTSWVTVCCVTNNASQEITTLRNSPELAGAWAAVARTWMSSTLQYGSGHGEGRTACRRARRAGLCGRRGRPPPGMVRGGDRRCGDGEDLRVYTTAAQRNK